VTWYCQRKSSSGPSSNFNKELVSSLREWGNPPSGHPMPCKLLKLQVFWIQISYNTTPNLAVQWWWINCFFITVKWGDNQPVTEPVYNCFQNLKYVTHIFQDDGGDGLHIHMKRLRSGSGSITITS